MRPTYGVPAHFSFIISGLGQLVKAFIIWVVGGAIGFLLAWTLVVPFGIWAWNVYDAYNSPA
ncbi:hypothetical protein [Hymenobacter persicinus]|uniref:Inner membrane component domain-containing protein n=1 Tax=Hymenobacter persicinus TaxID=2025506 RepID=A0A4Q5LDG9_9BACT|nr:hypothetical protein [Hymenobacter persicinus]RYU81608.1 hypothetical protein EWM57_06325 [Hymenobacter persicinus]